MNHSRYRLPSMQALVTFECVARLGGVSRAAQALCTSQPAVSRQIRQLEAQLGYPLFDRAGRGIGLNASGESYLASVLPALQAIQNAAAVAANLQTQVTIACSHEVSHLLLMPHFAAIRRETGTDVGIRLLSCEYEFSDDMVHAGADINFHYQRTCRTALALPILREALVPVCSPDYYRRHQRQLDQTAGQWHGLTLLSLDKANHGWMSWLDWYRAIDSTMPAAAHETFDNYVYLLEAAVAGDGLGLAWRGFADRYIQSGVLQQLSSDWQFSDVSLHASLTVHGEKKPAAQRCLAAIAAVFQYLDNPGKVTTPASAADQRADRQGTATTQPCQ